MVDKELPFGRLLKVTKGRLVNQILNIDVIPFRQPVPQHSKRKETF